MLVPRWLIFKTCQFGTSFLLHGFKKNLWLKIFFLGHLEYSSHILAEKILLIKENPKFRVIGRVNISFLIFPSTEFNFSNFFSIRTSPRILGNQNQRLLISFLLLFQNSHSELNQLRITNCSSWKSKKSIAKCHCYFINPTFAFEIKSGRMAEWSKALVQICQPIYVWGRIPAKK